jgi:hypothetical protein
MRGEGREREEREREKERKKERERGRGRRLMCCAQLASNNISCTICYLEARSVQLTVGQQLVYFFLSKLVIGY